MNNQFKARPPIQKPGKHKKTKERNKTWLDLANGETCRCCTSEPASCSCHYNGAYSHMLGNGTSVKCDDLASVPMCQKCHDHFDKYTSIKGVKGYPEYDKEVAARDMHLLALCMEWLVIQRKLGNLKLLGDK